jgi:Lysine-specific metallo-endopeptidase
LDKTDPGGLAGCGSLDGKSCDSARAAQDVAIKDVKAARAEIQQLRDERAAVASGKQDGLSDAAKTTESQVNSYFKSSDNKTLGKIDSVLGKTQSILEDDGSKYNFKMGGSDVHGNTQTLGYANPFSSKITLTPEFFGVSQRTQVETLIHEPAHIQGINVFPFQRETYDNDVLKLSGPRALNNADSYAQFVPH